MGILGGILCNFWCPFLLFAWPSIEMESGELEGKIGERRERRAMWSAKWGKEERGEKND